MGQFGTGGGNWLHFMADITTTYENSILYAQEYRMMARQLSMQTEYARQHPKSNAGRCSLTNTDVFDIILHRGF